MTENAAAYADDLYNQAFEKFNQANVLGSRRLASSSQCRSLL